MLRLGSRFSIEANAAALAGNSGYLANAGL